MIVFRRVLAVLLALVFFAAFLATVVLTRTNGTVASPGFYSRQLAEAEVYTFLYDELAPLAIREAREEAKDPMVDFARLEKEVVGAVRATFPPEFLQEQADRALDVFIPYLVNKKDTFAITLPLSERLRSSGPGIKQAISTGNVPEAIYDGIVTKTINDALAEGRVLFGLQFTAEELVASVRRMAPPDFLQDQINRGIDAVLPYFAGDRDQFTIVFDIAARRDAVAVELKSLIGSKDLQGFVLTEVLDPMVDRNIGTNFRVPCTLLLTVVVSPADVKQAIRETVGGPWLTARINEVTAATVDFTVGKANTFNVVIPLADRKPVAAEAVGRLMEARHGRACAPGFRAEVERQVANALPNAFTFAEADLRRAFGPQQSKQLDDIRGWFREGITFTNADLERELAEAEYEDTTGRDWARLSEAAKRDFISRSGRVKDLHDGRDRIRKGFNYTQDDFTDDLRDSGGQDAVDDLEDFRDAAGKVLGLRWYGWLAVAVLLIGIGALGGRRGRSKIAWGAAVLCASALISVILIAVAGHVASNRVEDEIREEFAQELNEPGTSALERAALVKAEEVLVSASNDALSGMSGLALVLLIVSALVLVLCLLWPRVKGLRLPRWRQRVEGR